MPAFTMELKGADALLKKLLELETKTAKKVMQKGLRAGAKITLDATKARAPVLSGRLKRSLVARASMPGRKKKRGTLQMLVYPSTKKEPKLVTEKDGARWYYPSVVEFGSSKRPANPFMRRAFDATKQQASEAIIRVANQALMEEARK